MKSGESSLSYILISLESAMPWGDIGSGNSVSSVGTGVEVFHRLTVVSPPGQYVPAGNYTDQLVVTFI